VTSRGTHHGGVSDSDKTSGEGFPTVATMSVVPSAIGLVASDLARTLSFYRALGLDIPLDADDEPHVEVTLPGGFRIMFDPESTVTSFDPEWTPPPVGSPRTALAFECSDPTEVDTIYRAMTAAGYDGHLEPWDAFWGQRYATLRDPDGNGVDLFAALPTS
jgi:catechol 2,3-dioxygenase-like lactoylglutathione lyase family enzyme